MSYTFHSHLTREEKHASQEDNAGLSAGLRRTEEVDRALRGHAEAARESGRLYAFPDLLDGLSPELKRRMQGKSCFNFKAVDKALFKELGALTRQGYQRFKKEGLV